MTWRALLPERGIEAQARNEIEAQLLAAVGVHGRPRRRGHTAAMVAVAVIGIGGVGAAAADGFHLIGYDLTPAPGKSIPVSTNLRLSVSPDHGPIGTVVNVRVTGCFDPKGDNHSVTYDAASGSAEEKARAWARDKVNTSTVVRTGAIQPPDGVLIGRFVISYAPAPSGNVHVFCGMSHQDTTFTVTGSRSGSAQRRELYADVLRSTKTATGFRLVLQPARRVEMSDVPIPGRAPVTVDVPGYLTPYPLDQPVGGVIVTFEGDTVVGIAIAGG